MKFILLVSGYSLCFTIPMVTAVSPEVQLVPEGPVIALQSGSTLDLQCNASGHPQPEVAWSFNRTSIMGDNERILVRGSFLSVLNVSTTDSGIYHCSATSEAGTVSSSRRVLVLDEALPTNVTVILREDAVLTCGNDSLPLGTPVVWFKDSRLEAVSDRFAVTEMGSLLVREVGFPDAGRYRCDVGGQIEFVTNVDIVGT